MVVSISIPLSLFYIGGGMGIVEKDLTANFGD